MRWVRAVASLTMLVVLGAGGAHAQGPVDARLAEAIGWYTGTAGRVDDARARTLIEGAAADGDVLAHMWIARAWSRGRLGYARDDVRARQVAVLVIEAVRRQAERGVAEAQFLIGTACDEGLGMPEDPALALEWFHKAAAAGHVLAAHNIGNAYASGRGVSADAAAAVRWWLTAATRGDAVPQLRLGEAYEHGTGVHADRAAARHWYSAAAARGNKAAAQALERLGPPR